MIAVRPFFAANWIFLLSALPSMGQTQSIPNVIDCVNAFNALQFDIKDYHRYGSYFREDSKIVLAQAGEYVGPKEIEQFVRFGDGTSTYMEDVEDLVNIFKFKSIEPSAGTCVFLNYVTSRVQMNPKLGVDSSFLVGKLAQIHYKIREEYVSAVDFYYTQEFVEFLFSTALNTASTRNFICQVSEKRCPEMNIGMDRKKCLRKLSSLPILTEGSFVGNNYGCRVLHAFFALKNNTECPNISVEPPQGPEGNHRCQKYEGLSPQDFFDQYDLQEFRAYMASQLSLIGSDSGFKILYMPKQVNTTRRICFGLVVPVAIFFIALFITWKKESEEKQSMKKSNPLLTDGAYRLWIILIANVCSLIIANGLAAVIIWAIAKNNPGWDETQVSVNKLEDRYRGTPGIVSETVPQFELSDDQFKIYIGFITWATCVLSGLGLEAFVWYYFLQVWCKAREGVWRFAQFLFPLWLITAIGLASHQNYLALPLVVFGLWKLGFPETLMYMYLGLFSTTLNHVASLADLINGVGTVLHHGAAAMLLSMLVVGAIYPSRYVVDAALLLVMQHWFVMLAYANKALFTSITLVLEYYFEWSVFSNFPEIYHVHWIIALVASVMVFAHWLYIIAAVLEIIVAKTCPDDKREHNVHIRAGHDIQIRQNPHELNTTETYNEDNDAEHQINFSSGDEEASAVFDDASHRLSDKFLHQEIPERVKDEENQTS